MKTDLVGYDGVRYDVDDWVELHPDHRVHPRTVTRPVRGVVTLRDAQSVIVYCAGERYHTAPEAWRRVPPRGGSGTAGSTIDLRRLGDEARRQRIHKAAISDTPD